MLHTSQILPEFLVLMPQLTFHLAQPSPRETPMPPHDFRLVSDERRDTGRCEKLKLQLPIVLAGTSCVEGVLEPARERIQVNNFRLKEDGEISMV